MNNLTAEEKVKIYEQIEELREEKSRWEWDDAFTDEPMFYMDNRVKIVAKIRKLQEKLKN